MVKIMTAIPSPSLEITYILLYVLLMSLSTSNYQGGHASSRMLHISNYTFVPSPSSTGKSDHASYGFLLPTSVYVQRHRITSDYKIMREIPAPKHCAAVNTLYKLAKAAL